MRITYRMDYRGEGRKGTAILPNGKEAGWRLVPSESNRYGGQNYDWSKALPDVYRTKSEAAAARKAMRQNGLLP